MSRLAVLLFAALFATAIAKHHVEAEEDSVALEEQPEQEEQNLEEEEEEDEFDLSSVISGVKSKHSQIQALHKSDITDNYNSILDDAKQLKTATGQRAKNLKLAIQDRVKALDLQMKSAKTPSFEEEKEEDEKAEEKAEATHGLEEEDEEEEEEKVSKAKKHSSKLEEEEDQKVHNIENDIKEIRAEVMHSKASKTEKKETLNNLDKILDDARRFRATHDAKIKKAMNLRLEALEEQLGESKVSSKKEAEHKTENKASRVAAVVNDVHEVRSHLSEHHLSKKSKREVLDNLDAIEADAKRFSKASGETAKRLSKAINLRMEALEEQLA